MQEDSLRQQLKGQLLRYLWTNLDCSLDSEELYLSNTPPEYIEKILHRLPERTQEKLQGFGAESRRFDSVQDYQEYVGVENVSSIPSMDSFGYSPSKHRFVDRNTYFVRNFLWAVKRVSRQASGYVILYEGLSEKDVLRIYEAILLLDSCSLFHKFVKVVAFPQKNTLVLKSAFIKKKCRSSLGKKQASYQKAIFQIWQLDWAYARPNKDIQDHTYFPINSPEFMFKIKRNTTFGIQPERWLLNWVKEEYGLDSGKPLLDVKKVVRTNLEDAQNAYH